MHPVCTGFTLATATGVRQDVTFDEAMRVMSDASESSIVLCVKDRRKTPFAKGPGCGSHVETESNEVHYILNRSIQPVLLAPGIDNLIKG